MRAASTRALSIALLLTTLGSVGLAGFLTWNLVSDPDRRARFLGTEPPPIDWLRHRSAFWNNGSHFMPTDWTAQPARDPNLASSSFVLERLRREGAPPELMRTIVHNVGREQFPRGPIPIEVMQSVGPSPQEAEAWATLRQLRYGDLTSHQQYEVSRVVGRLGIQAREAGRVVGRLAIPGRRNGLAAEAAAQTELEAILSPSQLVDVLRYHFPSTKALQETLASIQASEAEYLELADAVIARERKMPGTGNPRRVRRDPELTQRVVREFHDVLGDERFLAVFPQLSPRAATIRDIYASAGFSTTKQAQLILRAQDADTAIALHESGARKEGLDRSFLELAYQDLTTGAGLNLPQIAAFDQTEFGGVLKRLSTGK